jgi:GT2 family glycosyltransferase
MVRRRFPRAGLIENRANLGFARASNQAIRAGRGGCVLLLNSDAFLTPQAVRRLLGCLQADGQIGIAGAALVDPRGRPQPSHGRLPSLPSEILSLFGLDKLLSNPSSRVLARPWIETGWVSGACLLARRSMLDQIGLLDESFFLFGEEVDLCCRARLAGWKVALLPAARVVHVGGGSMGVTAHRILLLYRGKLRYFEKHFGRRAAERLWAAMRCTSLGKLCLYSLLRLLSLGKVRKDALWSDIAGRLPGLPR